MFPNVSDVSRDSRRQALSEPALAVRLYLDFRLNQIEAAALFICH
ncbi:hypothetical protein CEV32_3810 [Brucella rhizosphaerae]|uniref:Uncharacterized protein n=1 Tax=Brucella rhizosphaerae TaxID=571254 RepID=A0A256FT24_9HYPH|nr:hypothetical protein CEV32_3810 [Brucella rhizosphaerae]